MTPEEAGRELARATAAVRSVGRQLATWRVSTLGGLFPALILAATLLPSTWLATPGSAVPMVFTLVTLGVAASIGIVVGATARTCTLGRRAVELERAGGLARGDFLGALELAGPSSEGSDLAALHRARVARAVAGRPIREMLPLSYARIRDARRVGVPILGASMVVLAVTLTGNPGPTSEALSAILRSWAVSFPPPPPPLRLEPRGGSVTRGARFRIVVTAEGRSRVSLAVARAGVPPLRRRIEVDGGLATGWIDPVDEVIRYWAEDDDGAATDTFVVRPVDPLTVTDLDIRLQYPGYLRRKTESVRGPITSLRVPAGSRLEFSVRTNHPVTGIGLVATSGSGVDTLDLTAEGTGASGALEATQDLTLEWWLVGEPGVSGVKPPSPIAVSVEVDGPPEVRLVHPGEDVSLGLDRELALIVEAGDDHGLSDVGLTWWRETAGGGSDPPVRERLSGGEGERRVTLRPVLDLEESGFLPGDEIVYFATAADLNPGTPQASSDTFRARLSDFEELRRELADRSELLADDGRSLQERLSALADDAHDAERRSVERREDHLQSGASPDRSDFGSTGEARDLLSEAGEVEAELERLGRDLREVRDGVEASALTDPALQRRLGELESLFQEILESGLRDRIEALERSLSRLQREDVQRAVSDLSRRTADVEERLDRALGLLERVAVEQSLVAARQEAEELARRERGMANRDPVDRMWRREQEDISGAAEELAKRVEELADRLDEHQAQVAADRGRQAAGETRSAAASIREAASDGERQGSGDRTAAELAREGAADLERAERALASASESLAEDWHAEAMEAVGRATAEALELAREQERILERVQSGERPEDVSGRQSALSEGLDNLTQSLSEAGRKTALMDRRTGPAAARAAEAMDALSENLAAGLARRSEAMRQGRSAMEALGDLAGSLMASRRAMAEASSATGMEEFLERLAEMGRRQAGLNEDSGDLLMFISGGNEGEEKLEALAARQRGLSRDLMNLSREQRATEAGSRPEELAVEAGEIAARLSGGTLDRETLARQEHLFRRLLDAGRSLQKEERDVRRREARAARPRVALPPGDGPTIDWGPRHPYPAESELEGLTANQRRLVYDYFDRLNRDSSGRGR